MENNPDYLKSFPMTSEVIPYTTLVQQFNINEKWFAKNWSGICSQLTKITQPTLIITGT